MRYFLIAGEASGDVHGAHIIDIIKANDAHAIFAFWGGDQMQMAASTPPLKHIRDLAFMGFVQVIKNLPAILGNFKKIREQLTAFRPDKVIFIDYPGFNLRLAKWVKSQGFATFYYISPSVWAWHESRIDTIRKYIDHMMVILPFEQHWYAQRNIHVDYVGNPLLQKVKSHRADTHFKTKNNITKPILALLPGSRNQEIKYILPEMLQATLPYSESHHIIVSQVDTVKESLYLKQLHPHVLFLKSNVYDLLSYADLAIVTSGTATLETAFFGVPQVVCYKTNRFNYLIGKMLIKTPYISLVNIIARQPLVRELIQDACTAPNIKSSIQQQLANPNFSYQVLYDQFQNLKITPIANVLFGVNAEKL